MLGTLLAIGATGFATDIILDNTDATGVTITGTWTQATTTYGYWGTNYSHDGNAGKGTKSVRFTPTIPAEGDYDVYLRWTAANDRASNVPVDVVSATGTTTATVNQQLIGAAWVRLTTAHFLAGTSGSVLVRTDGTNGFVVADAVRIFTAGAPSNALVESLTPMEPARMLNGLGWNINMDQEWEFQKVKEARGREVRIQFGWEQVEAMDGTLSLSTKFQNALAWCVKYGLEPIIVAAYGPARTTLTNLTVTANVPVGSYVIPVSGTAALPYTDFTGLGAIVVDNADATGVTITGAWSTLTNGSGYWGSNCLSDQGTGKGTKNVRFTPNLPAADDYDIYVRWPATGTRSGSVPVDVNTTSGTETIPVAQNANAGSWILLKRATCAAGTGSSVLIRNDGTTAGELVLADAAAWVPVAATDAPIRGCHVQKSDNSQIVASGKWAYYGALIDSVDPAAATITLAAKTNIALTAGTVLKVNQLRYASAATISATDPGWVAYARYVKYLADQVGAYGLKGRVELWNEPAWPNDSWDHRGGFYDNAPIGSTTASPNYGMERAVLDHVLPASVRYSWGGSHKSGTAGVMDAPLPKPTQAQVANAMPTEGWHPYGPTPEWHLWYPNILLTASNVFTTGLEGTNGGSNNKQGRRNRANRLASNGWSVPDQISETGHGTSDDMAQARWVTRAFLSNLCIGPAPLTERVNFYRLTDIPGGLGMIDSTTRVERSSYIALKGLMDDVHGLGVAAAAYTASDLPSITPGYVGYYPLTTIPLVGRASASETLNHIIYVCYQRTYADVGTDWDALACPAVPVTVNIPTGYTARRAWDLTTRLPVPITVAGSQVTYPVADNAIALLLVPPTVTGASPIPANDTVTMNEGVTVDIDVLANDTDPDFGPETLFIQSITQPAHGTAAIVNGQIRYSPNPGYYGSDALTYIVSDGDTTATAGVTITINSTATANNLNGAGLTGTEIGTGTGSSRVLANGTWEVNGTGAGAAASADALWFENLTQSGGFRVRVLVQSLAGAADARAGLIVREGSGASARFVQVSAAPDGSARFSSRSVASAAASAEQLTAVQNSFPNQWLLIERAGNEVTIRVDDNNDGYADVGRVMLSGLSSSLSIGLFTAGGSGGTSARAVFTSFSLTPLVTWDGGAGTQNWGDAANWNPDGIPTPAGLFNLAVPNGSGFIVKQNTSMNGSPETTGPRLGSITIGPDATLLRSGQTNFFTGRNFSGTTAQTSGVVTNAGTMRNDTTNSTWLFQWSPVTHINSGTIEARNSGAITEFDFGTATLNNSGGTLKATSGGVLFFHNSLVVSGGNVTTDATSQVQCFLDNRDADFTNVQIINAGTWLHQQASATTGSRTNLSQLNGSTFFDNTGTFKIRQAMTSTDANTQTAVVELHNTAQFTNEAAGSVIISNECTSSNIAITGQRIARLDIPDATAIFNNLGTVTITDTLATVGLNSRAELRSAAPFTNQGQINVTGARSYLTMTGTQPYRQAAGSTVLSGGTITAATTSIEGGTLKGSGTVSGNLAFSGTGAFEAQLQSNGTSNLVAVSGQVQLGGALQVTLPNGYTPAGGTEFRIMTATGGFAGTIASVPLTWRVILRGTDLILQRDSAPTVAQHAAASANPVTSGSVNLSALGADDGGEANLIYTWQTTGTPPGPVTFSANATNASKTTTVSFTNPGDYTFQLTIQDQSGLVVTDSVSVTVQQNIGVWSNARFTAFELSQPLISGPLADPDFDGFCNLLEYAMGLNPQARDAASHMPTADKLTGFLRLTFTRPRPAPPDLIYDVEVKANLASGLWQVVPFDGPPVNNGNGTETLTAKDTVPASGMPSRFIHLRVRVAP